jgi:D-3-phosphoglycerate dehydrogenase
VVDPVVENLIVELLEWIVMRERTYEEVMDAWRTSCPKLPIWEEANDRKFVAKQDRSGRCVVSVTAAGSAFMDRRNRRANCVKGSAH